MIADLGPHLRRNAPEGAEVIDCKGHVLAPGIDRCAGVHRRARLRASRDLEDREPCRRGRRRHDHGRHARYQPGHRSGRARRFHPAARARQRHRQRAHHGGDDQGPQGRGDDRDRPPEAGRRGRLLQRQVERRQHARDAQRAALRPATLARSSSHHTEDALPRLADGVDELRRGGGAARPAGRAESMPRRSCSSATCASSR